MNLREIERLVAERVMGWRLRDYETGEYASTPAHYEAAASNDGWVWVGKDSPDKEAWQWKPSTKPEHARLVRQRLAEKWDWILGCGKFSPAEPLFGFALYEKNRREEGEKFIAEAETEELASCLGALKSCGVDIGR